MKNEVLINAKKEMRKWGSSHRKREQILTAIFGQLPFAEAKAAMLVAPLPIDKGDARDPFNCRIANALKRMYGCGHAIVVGTVAYVDLPDGKGGRVITRFLLSGKARKIVHRNDEDKNADVPDMIELLPPPKSRTLKYEREIAHRRRQNAQYRKKDNARRDKYRGPNRGLGVKPSLVRIAIARTAAGLRSLNA